MTHKINLTTGAAHWLTGYLSVPQLVSGTADAFHLATLVTGPLEPAIKPPIAPAEEKAWVKTPFPEFEITESQREAVKRALTAVGEKKAFVLNQFTLELLTCFGLSPA